jgi:hypothetical protein
MSALRAAAYAVKMTENLTAPVLDQATLFNIEEYESPKVDLDWCADDWETPNEVAQWMVSLLRTDEGVIMEPAAGTGQIAKHLPKGSLCVELNPLRYITGKALYPHCHWINDNWLMPQIGVIDCIIGNPPFSLGIEFLAAGARRLNKRNPNARILFLLPTAFFQAQCRAAQLAKTGLSITHEWRIAGRVAYLKDGIPHTGRQCSDSVFELKLNSKPVVEIADPYKKL